jgi:hypothetical protein
MPAWQTRGAASFVRTARNRLVLTRMYADVWGAGAKILRPPDWASSGAKLDGGTLQLRQIQLQLALSSVANRANGKSTPSL